MWNAVLDEIAYHLFCDVFDLTPMPELRYEKNLDKFQIIIEF